MALTKAAIEGKAAQETIETYLSIQDTITKMQERKSDVSDDECIKLVTEYEQFEKEFSSMLKKNLETNSSSPVAQIKI